MWKSLSSIVNSTLFPSSSNLTMTDRSPPRAVACASNLDFGDIGQTDKEDLSAMLDASLSNAEKPHPSLWADEAAMPCDIHEPPAHSSPTKSPSVESGLRGFLPENWRMEPLAEMIRGGDDIMSIIERANEPEDMSDLARQLVEDIQPPCRYLGELLLSVSKLGRSAMNAFVNQLKPWNTHSYYDLEFSLDMYKLGITQGSLNKVAQIEESYQRVISDFKNTITSSEQRMTALSKQLEEAVRGLTSANNTMTVMRAKKETEIIQKSSAPSTSVALPPPEKPSVTRTLLVPGLTAAERGSSHVKSSKIVDLLRLTVPGYFSLKADPSVYVVIGEKDILCAHDVYASLPTDPLQLMYMLNCGQDVLLEVLRAPPCDERRELLRDIVEAGHVRNQWVEDQTSSGAEIHKHRRCALGKKKC